jgi:hypothetical protein
MYNIKEGISNGWQVMDNGRECEEVERRDCEQRKWKVRDK